MRHVSLLGLFALTLASSAQTVWMREVALECAYYHPATDDNGDPEHDFLLFYGNDSVVQVTMAEWEGAMSYEYGKLPVQLIDQFVDDFHCIPEEFNPDTGVDVLWFAGTSMVWRDGHIDQGKFDSSGTLFLYGDHRYTRIKCWNRIVLPRWSGKHGQARFCTDEPEEPEEEEEE